MTFPDFSMKTHKINKEYLLLYYHWFFFKKYYNRFYLILKPNYKLVFQVYKISFLSMNLDFLDHRL